MPMDVGFFSIGMVLRYSGDLSLIGRAFDLEEEENR